MKYESNLEHKEELNGDDLVMIELRLYDSGECFEVKQSFCKFNGNWVQRFAMLAYTSFVKYNLRG